MAEATALADGHPDVYTTAGLHPHYAADWSEEIGEEIRARATHPRCVAIGETGLDWFRTACTARRPDDGVPRATGDRT